MEKGRAYREAAGLKASPRDLPQPPPLRGFDIALRAIGLERGPGGEAMFTRREFMKTGAALVSLGAGVPKIFRQGLALADYDASDQPERTLVVLQLAGGNDGLNTVVPYSDGAYHTLRPSLCIAPDKVIQLNGSFGL